MDTYPLKNSQEKKCNLREKPFQKDNFDYYAEILTYICHLVEILYRQKNMNTKTTKNKLLNK